MYRYVCGWYRDRCGDLPVSDDRCPPGKQGGGCLYSQRVEAMCFAPGERRLLLLQVCFYYP